MISNAFPRRGIFLAMVRRGNSLGRTGSDGVMGNRADLKEEPSGSRQGSYALRLTPLSQGKKKASRRASKTNSDEITSSYGYFSAVTSGEQSHPRGMVTERSIPFACFRRRISLRSFENFENIRMMVTFVTTVAILDNVDDDTNNEKRDGTVKRLCNIVLASNPSTRQSEIYSPNGEQAASSTSSSLLLSSTSPTSSRKCVSDTVEICNAKQRFDIALYFTFYHSSH